MTFLRRLLGVFGISRSPARDQYRREMVSWVVLSNSHVELTVNSLREVLDQIYPGLFLPMREQGNSVVDGPVPGQFLIQSSIPNAAGVFLLNSVAGPHTEFLRFADTISEPSLRQLARTQRYWLSIELIRTSTTEEDAYRFIGSVLAELAPRDAALLVHPSKLVTIPFNDSVRRRLAHDGEVS